MEIPLLVRQTPSELMFTNVAYLSETDYTRLVQVRASPTPTNKILRLLLKNVTQSLLLNTEPNRTIPEGSIALSRLHRDYLRIPDLDRVQDPKVNASVFSETPPIASEFHLEVSLFSAANGVSLKDDDLDPHFKSFTNHVFAVGQQLALTQTRPALRLRITKIHEINLKTGKNNDKGTCQFGMLTDACELFFHAAENSSVIIKSHKQRKVFSTEFNFQLLGIGGLDNEFAEIFRRAFASRTLPPGVMEDLGISPVRGMLLYGPPGTGKTLIARQIGKALDAREPKIVNGPEVLNKFVGQSEENIRNLFKEAEEEYKKKGDASSLHIIIFDEIDAICKVRGSNPASSGVNDSIVNQLLSKIDGVDAINNILLIGMTNRMDLIDEALLRPGRLEVHVEICLPDTEGRLQILNIHTKNMKEANRLDDDANLLEIAEQTKNFSGAELAGLIRSAASFAICRVIDPKNLAHAVNTDSIKVKQADFMQALQEVKSAFGTDDEAFDARVRGGIVNYSREFSTTVKELYTRARQVQSSPGSVYSVLLTGAPGTGKTALACYTCLSVKFPFAKIVAPEHLVNFNESGKVQYMQKIFNDAMKSPLSLIVLDNVEALLEYTPIGPRFLNGVLQAIKALIRMVPSKKDCRVLIIGTTSEPGFIQACGLTKDFHCVLSTPLVHNEGLKEVLRKRNEDFKDFPPTEIDSAVSKISEPVGVKYILEALETAAAVKSQNSSSLTADSFIKALKAGAAGKDLRSTEFVL
eukprot:GHVP01014710.1.p1 GENE.GHVP01014710.1~~GHVP01014710.1.p1  ORF type:complete len:752 (+),score=143.11 GHVP01014710.1:72-2327(+)